MFKKTAGKKLFEFVVPKPKVNKTKIQEAQSALDKAAGKLKGKTAELEQTRFESKYGMPFTFGKISKKTKSNTELNKEKKERKKEDKKKNFKKVMKENKKVITKIFKAPEDFSKGGRAGKMGGGMMGRRFGMKKGSGKKFPDLTGDGKVTFADILKGRGVINGKKKGNKNGKTMS
jgi:hypothetical protein